MQNKVWDDCLTILKSDLTESQFNTWIKPLSVIEDEEAQSLTLLAPNKFVVNWVQKNYLEKIKNLALKLYGESPSRNQKIFTTISLAWIILIGYLTWWNGLKSPMLDKSFRWDEWLWFGIVTALAPYLFLYIWKPNIIRNIFKNTLQTI